jgi:uncharacterized protein (TIGR03435 family)
MDQPSRFPGRGLSDVAFPTALGLKLIPPKVSVESLVIDHIERPSEN